MKKAIIYLVLAIIFSCTANDSFTYHTKKITSNKIDELLYIKTMNWGLTGASQITVISTTDNIDFNNLQSKEVYIFEGLEPFLYKQSNDSLILYSQTTAKVPKNMKTKWKILQVKTDNPTIMDLRSKPELKIP